MVFGKISTKTERPGLTVIAMKKGETVTAVFVTPSRADELIEMDNPPSGRNTKITAKEDILVVAEEWDEWHQRAKHVRFVRRDRRGEGAQGLDFVTIEPRLRLRMALNRLRILPMLARGGFENAVFFEDEIPVPDSFKTGSRGWIILRKDATDYIKSLPPLENSGKIIPIWIEKVGFWGTPEELKLRFTDHDPTNDEPLTFDSKDGPSSEGRTIYRIGYDEGSRSVVHIWDGHMFLKTLNFEVEGKTVSIVLKRQISWIVLNAVKQEKSKKKE